MRGRRPDDKSAYFTIYTYPIGKKTLGGTRIRQRKVIVFRVTHHETFEANMAIADKWWMAIHMLLRGVQITTEQDIKKSRLPSVKKLLLLVNPHSGKGKAVTLFRERVVPLLGESGINYHHIITEYQGHAQDIVKNLNLKEWDGIIIVSGDGLLYEVINGIMERPDRDEAIKTPVGILPCGSGNALSAALLMEPMTNIVLHCTFLMLKGRPQPMDLVVVQNATTTMYSFLSVCWGIVSDVDIESEKFRRLGPPRFTIGAATRIAKLRSYRGKLSFLKAEDYVAQEAIDFQNGTHVDECCFCGLNGAHAGNCGIKSQNSVVPISAERRHYDRHYSSSSDSNEDILPHMTRSQSEILPNGRTMDRSLSYSDHLMRVDLLEDSSDTLKMGDELPSPNSNQIELSTDEIRSTQEDGASEERHLLPPLDQPLPSNWTTIEDDFVNISAVYQSHLSTDVHSWPDHKFDEGVICLQYIPAPISRKNLISMFLDLESGLHIKHSGVIVEYVKAFRIEPITSGEIMTVDGELVPYGPIQGEILPGKARVIV
uniref:Sphingosine kinase 2-like n=1 Tax=Saccoglossus kowalevskii TaxID=10224 RepID=A0ABM0LWD3_SACKO|nr:PREDICTED: sphingosine kinase 2-like [Saccoglossus kowalevskii]